MTLSGVNLLTGAVLAGVFIAVGPVIGEHMPQIPDFTQLLIGFGVVTIGRNPNGIGRFYAEVTDFWNRRQGRPVTIPDQLDPALTVAAPVEPAANGNVGHGGAVGCLSFVVEEISVRFGGLQALQDVNLQVHAGAVNGLIGPNGAGKTTLFNVITGLQPPTHGRVRLGGEDITRLSPHHRARLGIARTFQRLELFGTLTARENVQMASETRRRRPDRRQLARSKRTSILAHVGSVARRRRAHRPAAHRSGPPRRAGPGPGHGPVGAAGGRAQLGARTRRRPSSSGACSSTWPAGASPCLLVEHDMSLVMTICDHVSVLDYGAVIAHGDPATVQADPAVQAAYLGAVDRGPSSSAISLSRPPGSALTRARRPTDDRLPPQGPDRRRRRAPCCRSTDVSAAYGRIEVVHGVIPRGSRGLGLRPARPQRGGQVHAAQGGERPDAGHHGLVVVRRRGDPPRPCPTVSPAGVCAPSPKAGPSSPT